MKEIIDIPYGLKEAFNHENEWTALLCVEMADCLNNGIVIPDNPTNGQMIQTMFPNAECWEDKMDYVMNVDFGNDIIQRLDLGWWNAPYKVESEE